MSCKRQGFLKSFDFTSHFITCFKNKFNWGNSGKNFKYSIFEGNLIWTHIANNQTVFSNSYVCDYLYSSIDYKGKVGGK